MKKIVSTLISTIIMMSLLISGCGAKPNNDKAAPNAANEKKKFIVGLDDSFPPMGFKDEKGEIVGFDIDLAKEAAKRMGMDVEFKPVDWDGVVLSLKNKDIDVIWNGLTITEKRKEEIAFSKVYLENRQIIVVKKDSPIKSKADLAGKVVGLQMGSSSEDALKADTVAEKSIKEVRKFSNNTEALMDLKNGGIAAVIVDEVVGRYYMQKNQGIYNTLEDNFGKESYGVGMRKEDVDFKNKLDKALDSMKTDGKADEISNKWFGKAIISK